MEMVICLVVLLVPRLVIIRVCQLLSSIGVAVALVLSNVLLELLIRMASDWVSFWYSTCMARDAAVVGACSDASNPEVALGFILKRNAKLCETTPEDCKLYPV